MLTTAQRFPLIAHTQLTACVSGFLFGFAIEKGQVFLPRTIIGQLLLEDWTMMKVSFLLIF